jgi:hypothetical protein
VLDSLRLGRSGLGEMTGLLDQTIPEFFVSLANPRNEPSHPINATAIARCSSRYAGPRSGCSVPWGQVKIDRPGNIDAVSDDGFTVGNVGFRDP